MGAAKPMSKKRQITIVDLAEAAGVSIATVSNVLNRRNVPMTEETIRKVEEAAKNLGYRRNVMAASLSRRKSYELGMLVPSFGGYYGRFAEEMQKAAHLYGYHLSVFSAAGFDPEIEKRHIDVLLQRRVDGLFCHGLAMTQEATRKIVGDGTPLVLFNAWGWPNDIAAGAVNLDFEDGCRQAVTHLVEQGCRSLVYLGRKKALGTDEQRRIGFTAGIKQLPDTVFSKMLDLGEKEDLETLVDQVVEAADGVRPVGILAFDDMAALTVMSAIQRRSFRIPEDFKIMGINNDPVTSICHPTLTTTDIPYSEQAKLAIGIMLSKLGETKRLEQITATDSDFVLPEAHEIRIPLKLIARMSTLG